MYYVEILVAAASYHKNEALTYSSQIALQTGRIVMVALRGNPVLGVVVKTVGKPAFETKQVLEIPDLPALPTQLMDLLKWLQEYYPAPLGATVQLFLPGHLPKQEWKRSATSTQPPVTTLPTLTPDQKAALIALSSPGLHILHGETGSGKTRVYIELALRCFLAGKSSIILTPEIGLTTQLANSFETVFGDNVIVVHSGLTEKQRQQVWGSLLESKSPVIVIGARSALFAPIENLGLIVVDEAHETAYKQDQAPYYHTTTVAAKLAALHNATLVLGSATPLVRDYYMAEAKGRPIVRMTQLATASLHSQPNISVIDLKDRKQFEKSRYFSKSLIEAMEARLRNHEQVLLFLNRRGTARVVLCQNCGWQALCPHCDLPLVYHGDLHSIRCHSCNFKARAPTSCNQCGSTDIIFKSIGTKAIVDEAKRLFPGAKIMRFDTDNKKAERLEAHYENVHAGGVDIVVGTQTLAKGLDLPKLGLVGVILADSGLSFPDFSAQERTYQLLSQVIGRIGRGHRQGEAIIQTHSPTSLILQAIIKKDWSNFYYSELAERKKFLFPPFCYLLKLNCKRASSQSAQTAAESMAALLRNEKHNVIVEGPVPSFHEKVSNKFVWQLIIKAKSRSELTAIIKNLPSGWSYDIDPMNLL